MVSSSIFERVVSWIANNNDLDWHPIEREDLFRVEGTSALRL
jgi:hypothetical protein